MFTFAKSIVNYATTRKKIQNEVPPKVEALYRISKNLYNQFLYKLKKKGEE